MNYLVAALVLFLSVVAYVSQRLRQSSHLPPGPPSDPIIGHLRRMPSSQSGEVFHQWSQEFGDVMHLRVLSRSIVVLGSYQAALDLLDKRIHSDRPYFVSFSLMGWKRTLTAIPYGKRFQKHRRLVGQQLNSRLDFRPLEIREAHTLIRNIVTDSKKEYEKHLTRFSAAIITQVVAGHQITSEDDPFLRMAQDVSEAQVKAGPTGGTILEFFPWLRHFPSWFPGSYYAGLARSLSPAIHELHEFPYKRVQKQLDAGTAQPSFLATHVERLSQDPQPSEDDAEDIKGAAGVLYAAGSETTSSTLAVFLLAMVLYPGCQARAQEEIDKVIGSSRLPEFSDRESLPYVECILQETLRWNPVAPLAIPHRSMEDDEYRGMFIPKGSVIIANTRGMSLDENVYSKPYTFSPARFLPKPEGRGEPYFAPAFGFGRRICPGRFLADDSLWIAVSMMLATLTISSALDEHGNKIIPSTTMTEGLASHPADLKCCITSRSRQAEMLVLALDS